MLRYIWTNIRFIFCFIYLFVLAALFCVWTFHDLGSYKIRMSINDDIILQEDMFQRHRTRFKEMCREQSLLILWKASQNLWQIRRFPQRRQPKQPTHQYDLFYV